MRFKDKVAIVAGGAGGIGKGVSLSLIEEGAKVVVWDIDSAALAGFEKEVADCGGSVITDKVDVMDYSAVSKSVASVVEQHSKIDIMVSSVGGGTFRPVAHLTPELWDSELEYNLTTVFNCFHTSLQYMVKQKNGRLLCFMSTTGGVSGLAAYGAAKAGCKALIETIAVEHTVDNITANSIMPGFVVTPFTQKAFDFPGGEERLEQLKQSRPLGFNTVENVAKTALNVLDNERLTGQIISLN